MGYSCKQSQLVLQQIKSMYEEYNLVLKNLKSSDDLEQLRRLKIEIEKMVTDLRDKVSMVDVFLLGRLSKKLNKLYYDRAKKVEAETCQDGLAKSIEGTIPIPELPEEFTKEHLEVIEEIFGEGNLRATVMPSVEKLTDDYFAVMYPLHQRKIDTDQGLMSFSGSTWNFAIIDDVEFREKLIKIGWSKSWQKLLSPINSMRKQASKLQGRIILGETITKPNYDNGKQQYGTAEGFDQSLDTLLPIIRDLFGESTSRFNLSYNQIAGVLLPVIKKRINDKIVENGLKPFDFDVIVTPALITNQLTTFIDPQSSQTDCEEWSTELCNQDGSKTFAVARVGRSTVGGASNVHVTDNYEMGDHRGFRLSIVLNSATQKLKKQNTANLSKIRAIW